LIDLDETPYDHHAIIDMRIIYFQHTNKVFMRSSKIATLLPLLNERYDFMCGDALKKIASFFETKT
jgi:hypothetical protein